jgi:hypothetical protein
MALSYRFVIAGPSEAEGPYDGAELSVSRLPADGAERDECRAMAVRQGFEP